MTLTDKTRVTPYKNLSLEGADVFSGSEYKENNVGDAQEEHFKRPLQCIKFVFFS